MYSVVEAREEVDYPDFDLLSSGLPPACLPLLSTLLSLSSLGGQVTSLASGLTSGESLWNCHFFSSLLLLYSLSS